MNPRIAEFKSSFREVILRRWLLFPAKTTMNNINVDVREAIVSIGRMPSSPRLILNAVGTVDQKKIANPA
jgi:hypothetical protein